MFRVDCMGLPVRLAWRAHHNSNRITYVSAVDSAIVHLGLGEKEKALDWLDRGADEHGSEMMFIKTDPRLDLVRSEPRFQRLLQVMSFPD